MRYKIIEHFDKEVQTLCWTDNIEKVVAILSIISEDISDEDFEYNEKLILNKEYYLMWNIQYKYTVEVEDEN